MPRLVRFERRDFLDNYWPGLYNPGEHVSLIEPTGQGKSFFCWQLLGITIDQLPELRLVSLMPKPRDPATTIWAKRLDLKITDSWPPSPHMPVFQQKPRGYVHWPMHSKGATVEQNRQHLAAAFRKSLHEQYWKGNTITLADDVYVTGVLLGLNPELEQFWVAGQSMPSGLWSCNQKPSGTVGGGSVSSFSYNAPTHLFLGHDPDVRNQKRFSEIGGIDPALVSQVVRSLPIHAVKTPEGLKNISEKLYICKRGYMAIIGI